MHVAKNRDTGECILETIRGSRSECIEAWKRVTGRIWAPETALYEIEIVEADVIVRESSNLEH